MSTALFTSPQDAEQAFYDAFQRADLDAMMAVWAEDDEVYCVHPGGARLAGLERIRESFRQIFGSGATMRFQLRGLQQLRGAMLAVHSVYEAIAIIGERRPANAVIATNVYANIGGGWRMIAHHASPVAGGEAPAAASEPPPGVLH
jgi:uncharacterized protein (TIGR02246 family)